MTGNILNTLGGIGLFLLGMIWLTDGLRGLSVRAVRKALARFTRTPFSGAVTGALTTAAIQSSSATTVTAVGFVGAGLLTFPQALGVIFGANIGTTLTGWLVAILGFKLKLGEVVLPLVFLGALLRMFGGHRLSLAGTALAGFSLLFIGISVMTEGMAGFEGIVTPSSFPDDTLLGRLQLVALGIAITVITQSSSAGVATALAALSTGAISFPQAAAMVIGMDVGTTFTAALATLGGTTATRRTGLSHVIYNLLTAIIAFVLLDPYEALVTRWSADDQIALVAFHTSFNLLGVIAVLPFAEPFARLVTALVPARGPQLTRHLSHQMLTNPDAATDAAVATVREITEAEFRYLAQRLTEDATTQGLRSERRDIFEALGETRRFIDEIPRSDLEAQGSRRTLASLHILDHLGRLYFRCTQTERIETLGKDHRLRRLRNILAALARETAGARDTGHASARLNRLRQLFRRQRRLYREKVLLLNAMGKLDEETALQRLDAVRWLHRVAYHLWRIQYHLARMQSYSATSSHQREAASEVLED